MGFLDRLDSWLSGTSSTAAPSTALTPSTSRVKSPWSTGHLERIVWADILGTEALPVTRAEAMGVPAIARARHILVSTISECPLVTLDNEAPGSPTPWLQHTSTTTSPQHRMAWTVDDLIFYGWSLWVVGRDDDNKIIDAARCPFEWWKFGEGGVILVNDEEVPADSVVLIPGYHEGILNFAPRTVRGARELESQWAARASNPIPATELHHTDTDKLENHEIRELVDSWTAALNETGGAVAYTPHNIEVKPHGTASADLLIQGRNAAAIDAARAVGVPAVMVDASNVNSTLTYETTAGRNLEFREFSLSLYMAPIRSRLSLDDVSAPGERVGFDTSQLTDLPSPTGPNTED
ncbi:phage portal protein [Knoellia sp. CPCC 206450]|uniref:phage portal protein n=1 Tax=Knoellia tibetensis TaxID=3404798 RepID=UPI003B42CA3F